MKKVNFKKVLMALSIVMTFLFLGVEQANAQVSTLTSSSTVPGGSKALMAPPQGNFLSVDDALIEVGARIIDLKSQMEAPGLPQSVMAALEKEYYFYVLVNQSLQSGSTVPGAIVFAASSVVTDVYGFSHSVALSLRQSAISLLTI